MSSAWKPCGLCGGPIPEGSRVHICGRRPGHDTLRAIQAAREAHDTIAADRAARTFRTFPHTFGGDYPFDGPCSDCGLELDALQHHWVAE
jgi:hypothetical protein